MAVNMVQNGSLLVQKGANEEDLVSLSFIDNHF